MAKSFEELFGLTGAFFGSPVSRNPYMTLAHITGAQVLKMYQNVMNYDLVFAYLNADGECVVVPSIHTIIIGYYCHR